MSEVRTEHRGVEVIVSDPDPEYTGGNADDIVIYIDTDAFTGGNIRIRLNDSLLYIGNPNKVFAEDVEHNPTDGFFIVQK